VAEGRGGVIKRFHNEATFRTIKVGNVRTYSMLTAKFLPFNARVFQESPGQGLYRSEVSAKLSTTLNRW